jgi:O-antigen/teichoic acid export membrane protein
MQKLARDTIGYVIFNYLSLFLTTARGLILINILNPAQLGVYKLFFTYSSYFRYYNLGLNALSFYRAPGRGLQDTYAFVLRKINTTLAWSFGILFTIVFSFFWWKPLAQENSLDFIVLLLAILYFTQLAETYITIAKIRKNFRVVNLYNIIFAASSTALMTGIGYWLNLRGVMIGLTLSTIIAAIYVIFSLRESKQLAIRLTRRKIKTLFRHSFITILPGMFIVLFSTVEIWIIAYLFGAEETGYYSVVSTFINIILMLNTDSIVFLYSSKAREFRQSPAFVMKLTATAFAIILIICFAGVFVVDWGIGLFFPQYIKAAEIYKLCFWGIPFLVARNFVVQYISRSRTTFVTWILLFLLISKVALLMLLGNAINFYQVLAASNALFGVILTLVFLFSGGLSRKV